MKYMFHALFAVMERDSPLVHSALAGATICQGDASLSEYKDSIDNATMYDPIRNLASVADIL